LRDLLIWEVLGRVLGKPIWEFGFSMLARFGVLQRVEYCPECGGETVYDPKIKMYTCKSCGLTLTYMEIFEARRRNLPLDEREERKQKRREYLKWWLSKK